MSGTQVDHLPRAYKGLRPTQGRTLAVMQVSAGSQSFNSVNTLRILGRWMRMITIPNQSSVAKAYAEFDEAGRMLPSNYYDRIVDVAEELVRFTVLTRGHAEQLVDRYSERKDRDEPVVTPGAACGTAGSVANTGNREPAASGTIEARTDEAGLVLEPCIGIRAGIRKDPVQPRVAIPAADPPDNIAQVNLNASTRAPCVLM